MNRLYEESLLYDFYGELLTERQKQIFEEVVMGDYSLSEVAEECGISRQGVHDNVRRARAALAEYEEKLHLVEKFIKIREKIEEIRTMADDPAVLAAADEIIEEL